MLSLWQRWLERLTGRAEQDLEREFRSDLEAEAEEQQNNGLSPEEALYAAQRAFGNTPLVKRGGEKNVGMDSL